MHDNVKISVKVDAPVEKVWNALTSQDSLRNWYFDIPDFKPEVGNNFSFYEPGDKKQYHHHCEVIDVIPTEKLKYSWEYPEISKGKSLVKWELAPENDGTVVTLTHKGIETFHHLGQDFHHESFEQGWNEILHKSLKNYLEN